MKSNVIIIPAYNPPAEIIDYVEELLSNGFEDIVIIDDGSVNKDIFDRLSKINSLTIFKHAVNLGKGRGLKNSFNYILSNQRITKDYIGAITVDSDGQHLVEDVLNMDEKMKNMSINDKERFGSTLFLGSRDFDSKIVPFKSKFGNKITRFIFRLFFGRKLSDTQTGLRGIPMCILDKFVDIYGERFDYETNMLIYCTRNNIEFNEVPITTHYIDNNSESHFDAIWDSLKIYRLLFSTFFKYIISAVSSAIIDIGLFKVLTLIFVGFSNVVWISTIVARGVSSFYNYNINRKVVFEDERDMKRTIIPYYILVLIQALASAFFVSKIYQKTGDELAFIKIFVDGVIFLVNFFIQNFLIFKWKNKNTI